ncbi:virulence factor TspB C-terminal domain-related protein [Cellvibrio sp.]|uniref:virulence factor TspB C-terminal domain-related protein n=1 Tax=Cellvibrio sp. TaxID=1965322 RepID=UPI00396474C5
MKKYLFLIFALLSSIAVADPALPPANFEWRTQFYVVSMGYYETNQEYRNNINNAADNFSCSGGETVFIGVDPGYNQYGFYCDHNSYCAADEEKIMQTNIGPPKTVQAVCRKKSSSSSSSSSSLPCEYTESCSSSSSSSSSCPSGFIPSNIQGNATCVPDLNPSSSSAASASSASSSDTSTSSSPSSSGSASSVASVGNSSSASGGDTGSSGSGSSGGSSGGGDNPAVTAMQNCELIFGSGKCSVQTSQNACPNSYTSGGVVFCVASGAGSGSGSGSSSGNASSTPSTATPSNCSSAPACSGDAIQCALLKQAWINNCDGINSKVDINATADNTDIQAQFDNLINSSPVQTEADGSIKDIHKNIDIGNMSDVQDLMNSLDSAASTPSHGVCPAPRHIQLHLGSFQLSYQPFCDFATQVSYLVLFFFSLSGVLIIYRTVERA